MSFTIVDNGRGVWDVIGDGELLIAVSCLPFDDWAGSRMSMVIIPQDQDDVVDYMYGERKTYSQRRSVDPVFLMLRDPANIIEEEKQIINMGLNWREVDHYLLNDRWRSDNFPSGYRSGPEYLVMKAVQFDSTALMTLKMLMSD